MNSSEIKTETETKNEDSNKIKIKLKRLYETDSTTMNNTWMISYNNRFLICVFKFIIISYNKHTNVITHISPDIFTNIRIDSFSNMIMTKLLHKLQDWYKQIVYMNLDLNLDSIKYFKNNIKLKEIFDTYINNVSYEQSDLDRIHCVVDLYVYIRLIKKNVKSINDLNININYLQQQIITYLNDFDGFNILDNIIKLYPLIICK